MRVYGDDIMDGVNAWYVRKDGEVKGPFARGLLLRHRVLGRLRAEDEVSVDRINWFLAMEIPALDPDTAMPVRAARQAEDGLEWAQERDRARRRWMEERWRSDRKGQKADMNQEENSRRAAGQTTPGPRDILPNPLSTDMPVMRSVIIAGGVLLLLVFSAWLMNRYEDKSPLSIRLMPSTAECAAGGPASPHCEGGERR